MSQARNWLSQEIVTKDAFATLKEMQKEGKNLRLRPKSDPQRNLDCIENALGKDKKWSSFFTEIYSGVPGSYGLNDSPFKHMNKVFKEKTSPAVFEELKTANEMFLTLSLKDLGSLFPDIPLALEKEEQKIDTYANENLSDTSPLNEWLYFLRWRTKPSFKGAPKRVKSFVEDIRKVNELFLETYAGLPLKLVFSAHKTLNKIQDLVMQKDKSGDMLLPQKAIAQMLIEEDLPQQLEQLKNLNVPQSVLDKFTARIQAIENSIKGNGQGANLSKANPEDLLK